MVICGIDPGMTGALAFLRSDPVQVMSIVPMPLALARTKSRTRQNKSTVNWWAVTEAIRESDPDLVIVERQAARPGQGLSSTFAIGYQYGALQGILAALGKPYEIVEPATWKRGVGLLRADKSASRDLAGRLMPEAAHLFTRDKDHGLAEAALIALWKLTNADRSLD